MAKVLQFRKAATGEEKLKELMLYVLDKMGPDKRDEYVH